MTVDVECAICGLVLQSCCKQYQPVVYCPTTGESGPGTPICCLCLVRDMAREHVRLEPPLSQRLYGAFSRRRKRCRDRGRATR